MDQTERRRATAKALPKIASRIVQSAVGPKMRTAVAVRRMAVLAKYCQGRVCGTTRATRPHVVQVSFSKRDLMETSAQ
jgi:hypothetical protein